MIGFRVAESADEGRAKWRWPVKAMAAGRKHRAATIIDNLVVMVEKRVKECDRDYEPPVLEPLFGPPSLLGPTDET